MPDLLDANVLIALTVAEHEHHDVVATWVAEVDAVALCPLVEGALVRFLVRLGERAVVAQEVLRALHADPRVELWPDDVTYADVDLAGVMGHRQVTDAYLVALAAVRHSRLVTLDRGVAQLRPRHTLLLPNPRPT